MSIRQMSFDEGESLKIRECLKLPPNTSIEELKKHAENQEILIVKSGKSYFNVTAKPEIYDQAKEFDISSLTGIDKRDMQQTDATPAFPEKQDIDPMSMLYQNTSQTDEEEYEEYERKTYYLRLEQIEVLKILCFKENKDVSELVRELFDIAIEKKSEEHDYDFQAEAAQRLLTTPRKKKKRKKSKTKI